MLDGTQKVFWTGWEEDKISRPKVNILRIYLEHISYRHSTQFQAHLVEGIENEEDTSQSVPLSAAYNPERVPQST